MLWIAISAAGVTISVRTVAKPSPNTIAVDRLIHHCVDGAPTVTAPAGWTAAGNVANGSAVRTVAFARVAAPGDPASWDFTWTGTRKAAAAALAYRGVHGTTPVEITANATGSGTNHTAPSLATSGNGRELINVYATTGATSFTASSPTSPTA